MIEIVPEHRFFGIKRVLRGMNLRVENGEIVALLGPNDAGKSTLLQVLAGILRPDRGSVVIEGHDLAKARVPALSALGFAPENADLPVHLRAREWLDLVRVIKGPLEEDLFDTNAFASTRLGALSLGQRRRLLLTSALMGSPTTLALDEPTNGLDDAALAVLERVLTSRPGGILLATHDVDFARSLGARLVQLQAGRVGA